MPRTVLYATPHGVRYHRDPDCTGLGDSFWRSFRATITRREVVRRGMQPCGLCKPPPLLTAVP